MLERIIEILEEIKDDVDFTMEDQLVDGGILDSFDIISVVGELNDHYGIEIDVEDLEPVNFNTVEAMLELVEKLQNE